MRNWKDLKKELLENKEVARHYRRLAPRYQVISQLLEARINQGLTQKEVARKVGTKQSSIARFESGQTNPTFSFLEKLAAALDTKLVVQVR